MVSAPDRLDDAADQTPLQIERDLHEGLAFKGNSLVPRLILVEFQQRDTGLGYLPLLARTLALGNRPVRRRQARGPKPRPLEPRIHIGGIVDPDNAKRRQGRRKSDARHAEQRPQDSELRPFEQRRHAGEPIGSTATRGAHHYRLGLVVCLMRDQQMQNAALVAGLAQQAVARLARGLLHAGRRLGSCPMQYVALDALA